MSSDRTYFLLMMTMLVMTTRHLLHLDGEHPDKLGSPHAVHLPCWHPVHNGPSSLQHGGVLLHHGVDLLLLVDNPDQCAHPRQVVPPEQERQGSDLFVRVVALAKTLLS